MERESDKGNYDKIGNSRRLFVVQHIIDIRTVFIVSERITHRCYLVGILLGYGLGYEPT